MQPSIIFHPSPRAVRLTGALTILLVSFGVRTEFARAQVAPPPPPLLQPIPASLKTRPVPKPSNFDQFVVDEAAAIRLGKALFWDMQVGSDGKVACASCHFHAGVDPRVKNTLSPGANGSFNVGGPNYTLVNADFPFHRFASVENRFSAVTLDRDDVVGSQGVPAVDFLDIVEGSAVDAGNVTSGTQFEVGGISTRQVTGRNTPSVINAAHNFRNFWDGRASFLFNGVNPAGPRDPGARVLRVQADGTVVAVSVSIDNASLASQAVGPPGSEVEMSWNGRSFAKLARKLFSLQPLGQQMVSADDSVLGPLASSNVSIIAPGLETTYQDMIQTAFDPKWWSSDKVITFLPDGSHAIADPTGNPLTTDEFTVMEANFTLLWGMAILAYERTLISDDSRFDQWMDAGGPTGTKPNLLTAQEQLGLDVFRNVGLHPTIRAGNCIGCHLGPEFTAAATNAVAFVEAPFPGEPPPLPELPIEKMAMAAALTFNTLRFVSLPNLVEPGALQLDFEPRGTFMEIKHGTGPGAPVVFSRTFPGTPGSCTPETTATQLFPTGAEDLGPNAIASALLIVDDNCLLDLRIAPTLVPIGDYPFLVDGVEKGVMHILPDVIYDFGLYNIGVRPTAEDFGIGVEIPVGQPLSFARRYVQGLPNPELAGIQDTATLPAVIDEVVDGAFKVPSLRNVELTSPYFHNGGIRKLEDVVEFYNRGGDFHEQNIDDLAPAILFLGLRPDEKAAVVAFLKTLTDDRVRYEIAPFDHPQLFVANGHLGSTSSVTDDGNGIAVDSMLEIPEVGAVGNCIGVEGKIRTCNDGNPCTADECVDGVGCVNTPISAACNDGNACTTGDTCVAGVCTGGAPTNCSDGNVCTTDTCSPTTGCAHTNNTLPCSDNNACTTGDTCNTGFCIGGPATNCSDGNVCTLDLCDAQFGCFNVANTAACNDGDACTSNDTCSAGVCSGSPIAGCGNMCGDVDGDVTVGIVDALFVAQHEVGLRTCGGMPRPDLCDINPVTSDGKCNIGDALKMAQCSVSLISCDFACTPFTCVGGALRTEAASVQPPAAAVRLVAAADDAAAGRVRATFEVVVDAGSDAIGAYSLSIDCDDSSMTIVGAIEGGSSPEFSEQPVQSATGCHARVSAFQIASLDSPAGEVSIVRFTVEGATDSVEALQSKIGVTVHSLIATNGAAAGESVHPSENRCGDADGSLSITAGDALLALRASSGVGSCERCICDVDGSGRVNAIDALTLLRLSVGFHSEVSCPPCP